MKLTQPQLHLWKHYCYDLVRSNLELRASSLKHLVLNDVGVVRDGMKKISDDWLFLKLSGRSWIEKGGIIG